MPNLFTTPVPGQSLTNDPDSRAPWEQPPKFNTVNQALDHLREVASSPKFIKDLDHLLQEDKKFFIDELVAGMLSEGFINGLWTVDSMLLLVEPLTVLMVWTAAQLDRSPSFSSDTGYEDRTGFESLIGEVVQDIQVAEEEPVEAPQEPEEPQSPLVQGPQSPLVTGVM